MNGVALQWLLWVSLPLGVAANVLSQVPEKAAFDGHSALTLHQVSLTMWRKDQLLAKGSAQQMRFAAETIAADKVVITSNGSQLSADHLEVEQDFKQGRASAGVTLVTPEGCQLRCLQPTELREHLVVSNGSVEGSGCGVSLKSDGLQYDLREHRADFMGRVETRFEAKR